MRSLFLLLFVACSENGVEHGDLLIREDADAGVRCYSFAGHHEVISCVKVR